MLPTRLRRGALLLALATTLPAATAHAATPLDDVGYWAFADRMESRVDAAWNERAGYYRFGSGGVEPMANSMMLLTNAVAAAEGHEGPARNDHRARLLALRLVDGTPFVTRRPPAPKGSQAHAPGWVNSMTDPRAAQHLVFDAEVVDGLVYAYRARAALGLPDTTVAKIRKAIHSTAAGPFWRWPTVRLNQINWYALMYDADATVTGNPAMLKRDFRAQLEHFVRGARGTAARAGNFGPGMHFHYLPAERAGHPMNVDSAEYANIVLSFTRFYDRARERGMARLPLAHARLFGEWIRRAIAGYWTHGGYMNWDSGLGFQRWHQAKKLGLTQQALIGIATSSLTPDARWRSWAKYMLDRGLEFYDRLAVRAGGVPDPVLFKVTKVPQGPGSANLAATRMMANAARAVAAGLGHRPTSEPPALYAYDPDIGRLAVTTPAYNTAIVAVNQRAFPYGGLDVARLFDGDQEVAANIGGLPPASFGALVRNVGGRTVLASQVARTAAARGVTPLRLLEAPLGVRAGASAVGRAYAGVFQKLRVTGARSSRTASVRVTHAFTPGAIRTRWDIRRRSSAAPYSADVLFPSWGGRSARVVAVLRDGRRVGVGDVRISLASVAWLYVRSERSGYVVVPAARPAGATVHVLRTRPQSSEPDPGPTLAVQLARAARFSRAALTVRLVPVGDERQAIAAAERLK